MWHLPDEARSSVIGEGVWTRLRRRCQPVLILLAGTSFAASRYTSAPQEASPPGAR